MVSVTAKVRNGRLVVDEATDLPDGTEVELVAVMADAEDGLGPEERAALHRSLARASDDIDQGRLVDGDEVLARFEQRRK